MPRDILAYRGRISSFQIARMDGNPLIFGRHSMAPYTPRARQEPGQDRGALLTRRGVIQIPHDAEKPKTHTPQKNDHESKSIFHPITPFSIVRVLRPSRKPGEEGPLSPVLRLFLDSGDAGFEFLRVFFPAGFFQQRDVVLERAGDCRVLLAQSLFIDRKGSGEERFGFRVLSL